MSQEGKGAAALSRGQGLTLIVHLPFQSPRRRPPPVSWKLISLFFDGRGEASLRWRKG